MTISRLISLLILYLTVPAMAVFAFHRLEKRIKKEGLPAPPGKELFVLIASYAVLLLFCLTALIWFSFPSASLLFFYLIVVCPIIMIIIAARNLRRRSLSTYHLWAFYMSLSYFIIAPLLLAGIYFLIDSLYKY